MRKNLSGKTEFCKHTKNTARGRRGVNKLERQAPLPDPDQPAWKPRRRRKQKPRPWLIEWKCGFLSKDWELFSSFETKELRDNALAKQLRKFQPSDNVVGVKFVAVDPIVAKQTRK